MNPQHKKTYFITKKVQAKNFGEAVKNESKAEITNVWIDDKEYPKVDTHAIGFQQEMGDEISDIEC